MGSQISKLPEATVYPFNKLLNPFKPQLSPTSGLILQCSCKCSFQELNTEDEDKKRGVLKCNLLLLTKELASVLPSIWGINSGLMGMLVREAILRDLVSFLQCPVIVNGDFSNAEESKRNCFRKSYVQKQQSPACSSKVEQILSYYWSVIDLSHFHWFFCEHRGQIALENVCVYLHIHIYTWKLVRYCMKPFW